MKFLVKNMIISFDFIFYRLEEIIDAVIYFNYLFSLYEFIFSFIKHKK
jgi:hypothetical protein